eukprot:4108325-Heterocapsa_arctica.AAC.1
MKSAPRCLWSTGVITREYTALPDTEDLKAEDTRLNCTEKADKVYIDGSATKKLGPAHTLVGESGHQTMSTSKKTDR